MLGVSGGRGGGRACGQCSWWSIADELDLMAAAATAAAAAMTADGDVN